LTMPVKLLREETTTVVPAVWPGVGMVSRLEGVEMNSPVAVPERVMTWVGRGETLSVMVTAPVLVPPTTGTKVTERMQVAPAATDVPQVLLAAKAPVAAMEEIMRGAVPELVRVTIWAELVVPTVWEAKVRLVDERVTAGTGMALIVTVVAEEVAEAKLPSVL
jgi:hypothetical protein